MQGFAEALTQSMISGLDPMNGVIRSLAAGQVETQQIQLRKAKFDLMTEIEAKIKTLQDNGADTAVIEVYKKMHADLSR